MGGWEYIIPSNSLQHILLRIKPSFLTLLREESSSCDIIGGVI